MKQGREIEACDKAILIDRLTNGLNSLRAMANISQDDLASFIGVSRQTYSAIETKKKTMSWGTYLALIFYFDNNFATHELLRNMSIFPDDLIKTINGGEFFISSSETRWADQLEDVRSMIEELDDNGLHTVKTVIRMEYDRCVSDQE